MKIGISGAANCGKTTIARKIATDLGLPLIDEGFESINPGLTRDRTPQENLKVFLSILEEKRRLEFSNASGFVADRTPIDLVVFLCAHPQPHEDVSFMEQINGFRLTAKSYIEDYDYLVIPPWGVVSYSEITRGVPGFCQSPMNPWTNYLRHMAFLGTASSWLPQERILQPPADVITANQITEWLLSVTASN